LDPLIVIEVDGGQHAEARTYNTRRDDHMSGQGFRVPRFWNNDVLGNMEGVWNTIAAEFKT
jgi:very-short-patch-repair endonuclease